MHRTRVTGFDEQKKDLDTIAKNVRILLNKTIIKLPLVYKEEKLKQPVLLGNNFLDYFKTRVITQDTISLETPCNKWIILKRIHPLNIRGINSLTMERDNNLQKLKEKYYNLLKTNFGENALQLWDKEKIYAEI